MLRHGSPTQQHSKPENRKHAAAKSRRSVPRRMRGRAPAPHEDDGQTQIRIANVMLVVSSNNHDTKLVVSSNNHDTDTATDDGSNTSN